MLREVSTIFKIWNIQDRGYVALPRKKDNIWEEKNFKYPEEYQEIRRWIYDSYTNNYDIYWCPTILNNHRRITENIPKINILYADLDEVNPYDIPKDLKPSVAWQTSNNRYAAIWILRHYIDSKIGANLNKRLSYYLGADKGGWDLTQVLRIPNLPNFKYDPPQEGKLLWYKEELIYPISVFEGLPEVDEVQQVDFDDDIELLDKSVNSIIYDYSEKLNPKAIKLLLTPPDITILEDRSETLWELECMLFEAGMTKNEVYTIIKNSVWNKYEGRKDEEKRLKIEINKAYEKAKQPVKSIRNIKITTYSELMSKELTEPKWLIKDWWEAGSHGILAGEPKTYKSTVSTEIAISVASGKPLFGKYEVVSPGPVLIIQEENSEWLMQDRFSKIANSKDLLGTLNLLNGKTLNIRSPEDLPIYMVNRQGINLTSDEDRNFILNTCKTVKPVLTILDPIYLMFGQIDTNSAKDLNDVLSWLLGLSERTKSALMLVHHFNKNGQSSRGGQRMLGSVTFHAWVQSAIYNRVAEGKKNTVVVEREFRSFNAPDNVELSFNMGEPGEPYYEVSINENGLSVQELILAVLSNKANPITLKEITAQLNTIPQKEIKYTLSTMMKVGKIIKTEHGFILKKGE